MDNSYHKLFVEKLLTVMLYSDNGNIDIFLNDYSHKGWGSLRQKIGPFKNVGGLCVILTEGGKVIWSSDGVSSHSEEFVVERDPETGLMSVHVGSGQYEFQAVWK